MGDGEGDKFGKEKKFHMGHVEYEIPADLTEGKSHRQLVLTGLHEVPKALG